MSKNIKEKKAEQSEIIKIAYKCFPKNYTPFMEGMFPGKYSTPYMRNRLRDVFNSRTYDEDILNDIETAIETLKNS